MGYGHVRDLLCGLLFRSRGSAHITLHFTPYPIGCGHHRYHYIFRLFFWIVRVIHLHAAFGQWVPATGQRILARFSCLLVETTVDQGFFVTVEGAWRASRACVAFTRLRSVLSLSPPCGPFSWPWRLCLGRGSGGAPFLFPLFPPLFPAGLS